MMQDSWAWPTFCIYGNREHSSGIKMVIELNSVRNTNSVELNGKSSILKNCVIQNRTKEEPKPNSFQTILKKPHEKKHFLEQESNSSTEGFQNRNPSKSVDEKPALVDSNFCEEDPGAVGANETKTKSEHQMNSDKGEFQLSRSEECDDSSLIKLLDDGGEAGYWEDDDGYDFDPQVSWVEHPVGYEETPALSLEESRERIQAQHGANGGFMVFHDNTMEDEQAQIVLVPIDKSLKTNAGPQSDSTFIPGPDAKGFSSSHTKVGDVSPSVIQVRTSLEHENATTTFHKDLNSSEFISLQRSREIPELMSRGRNDSGVDLLSRDGLESLSSKASKERLPQMMEARDVVVVDEEINQSMMTSMSPELVPEETPRENNNFLSTLDDNDAFKIPNKMDASISPQMNALHQKVEAPLSIAPLRQVALQLTKALDTRVNHLSFQLDPEHLGKVDVELKIMNDNHVQAIFHVDNPESYELLRRDSAELQALLNEAGFESSSDDFSFNYRDPNSESGEQKSPFLSPSRTKQQEVQELTIEGGLDARSFIRRPDPSKTLDTLI